jgi:hypothetical protein
MSNHRPGRPHHAVPQLLPIRIRPHRHERTGSYLIRLATANHCQPWSFLRLLGNIPGGQRAQLTPRARVTMNHAALTRLAGYLGKPTDDLARAMPSIVADERWHEPTVLIRQLGRAFLRSCTQCEKRSGGAVLMPNPHPMQLNCQRHNTWLVTAEDIDLDEAPETITALRRLRGIRRRHGDDLVHGHYQRIREYLTNDWRGTGWHRSLVHRWTQRQQTMRPTAHPRDEFVRSHTEHWSMLPETVTLVGVFARPHRPLPTAGDISHALDLDHYWATTTTEHLHERTTFHPLRTGIAEQAADPPEHALLPI